jgi:hypothetical protein
METSEDIVEALLEKVDAYGKTSFELLKLRLLDTTAIVATMLLSRMSFILLFFVFLLFMNVGLALLTGEYLGKMSSGFLIVSLVNLALFSLIYFIVNKQFKNSIYTFLINQFLKPL